MVGGCAGVVCLGGGFLRGGVLGEGGVWGKGGELGGGWPVIEEEPTG